MSGSDGMGRRSFVAFGGTVDSASLSVLEDESARERALAETKSDGADKREVRSSSGVESADMDEGLGVFRGRPRVRFAG